MEERKQLAFGIGEVQKGLGTEWEGKGYVQWG